MPFQNTALHTVVKKVSYQVFLVTDASNIDCLSNFFNWHMAQNLKQKLETK